MIEIKCSQAQYDRLIDCAKSYFENYVCFLGKHYYSCPSINNLECIECDECLKKHIKRIGKNAKTKRVDKLSTEQE